MAVSQDNLKQLGEIRPDSLYRFPEAARRLGWSSTAMRTARRRGLTVKYFANRAYVHGEALISFLLANGKDTK
jgi:hypothetical protein